MSSAIGSFRLDSSAWCVIAMLADLADDCTRYVRKCDSDRPSGAGSIARPRFACHRVKYNVAFASFNRSSVATLASTAPMLWAERGCCVHSRHRIRVDPVEFWDAYLAFRQLLTVEYVPVSAVTETTKPQ